MPQTRRLVSRSATLTIDETEFREARRFPHENARFEQSDPPLARFLAKLRQFEAVLGSVDDSSELAWARDH